MDHCLNEGICVPGPMGTWTCDCSATGWIGDWCEINNHVDNCDFNPFWCQNGGTCQTGPMNTFTCECPTGYHGQWCEYMDSCDQWTCENGGWCFGDALCDCPGGFFGDACQYETSQFIPNCGGKICENGGSCFEINDFTYECVCTPEWTGAYCTLPAICANTANPCQNQGLCTRGADGKAKCSCPGDWTGPTCNITKLSVITAEITSFGADCRRGGSAACQNDGTCVENTAGTYWCSCTSDYYGAYCDLPAACNPDPCGDNGVCAWVNDDAVCLCFGDMIGDRCQYSIENYHMLDCTFNGCDNGVCLQQGAEMVCACDDGYTGQWCDELINDPCIPNPCLNNGMCTQKGDTGHICYCASGTFGPDCSIISVDSLPATIDALVSRVAAAQQTAETQSSSSALSISWSLITFVIFFYNFKM